MKNKKTSSRFLLFIVASFLVHVILLYVIPFAAPAAQTAHPKPAENLQKVEFIRLGQNGQLEKPNVEIGVEEPGQDKDLKVAQSPEVTTPVEDPKPEASEPEDPSKVTKEPVKNNATLTDTKKSQPVTGTPAPEKPTKSEDVKPGTATIKPGGNTNAGKVVTSKNSDKVIDLTETAGTNKSTSGDKTAKPTEGGQPAPGQVAVEEKKPNLPTNPGDTLGQMVTPVYPKNAANEKIEGVVELVVNVEETGKIKDVKVIHSSGDKRLDDVSINTVKRGWSFKEMLKPYTITLKVTFKSSDVEVGLETIKFQD